jgi:hypothetical protein
VPTISRPFRTAFAVDRAAEVSMEGGFLFLALAAGGGKRLLPSLFLKYPGNANDQPVVANR